MHKRKPDEDFWYPKKVDSNREPDTKKEIAFKIYAVTFTVRAGENFLKLWKLWSSECKEIPDKCKSYRFFRKIFPHIREIRRWNVDDQLNYQNFSGDLKQRIESGETGPFNFEIELIYSDDEHRRKMRYKSLEERVLENGGKIIDGPCCLPEIRYHAVMVQIPAQQVNDFMQHPAFKIAGDGIFYFKLRGQSASEFTHEFDESYVFTDDELEKTKATPPLLSSPVIMVMDGYPLENHALLENRLEIRTSDDFNEEVYPSSSRYHGTAISSLVLHGDIRASSSLNQRIVFVPINKIHHRFEFPIEEIPDDKITVGYIYNLLVEHLKGSNREWRESGILVINFSQGLPERNFVSAHSPLARLLDWISYRANVLFIISAGNRDISDSYIDDPTRINESAINQYLREHFTHDINNKLISPAESINGLTIGALNWNGCGQRTPELVMSQDCVLLPNILPSLISPCGSGYKMSLKPDLLYPGGRYGLSVSTLGDIGKLTPLLPDNPDQGIPVAAPSPQLGGIISKNYEAGTSYATALATHDAGLYYEALLRYFDELGLPPEIYSDKLPVLLKALLVHGSDDTEITFQLMQYCQSTNTANTKKRASQWCGNGMIVDTNCLQCHNHKVTLIGFGNISEENKDKIIQYSWNIPESLINKNNNISVTLAYLTPLNFRSDGRHYVKMSLDFLPEYSKISGSAKSTDASKNNIKKGTVQHMVYKDVNFSQIHSGMMNINITPNLAGFEKNMDVSKYGIPYALLVTLRASQADILTDLYSEMFTILSPQIQEMIGQKIRIEV